MQALSVALLFLLLQRPEAPPPPSVLVVAGSADILTAPDEAVVRVGVTRQSANAQAAQEQTNAAAQEVIRAIRSVGAPASQIQTARLVLSPVYAPRSPESREAPRIVGYNASNTVSVRLADLSQVGPVIDAALKAGANELQGVQFTLRNDLPSREEALKQAVNEAQGKARVMADALGVRLVEVLEAAEDGISVAPFAESAAAPRFAAAAAQTPVSPGQIEVRANVTLRYRIAPK